MIHKKETVAGQEHGEVLLEHDSDGSVEVLSQNSTITYEIGDHVYRWQSFLGVPFHTQQHGIVVACESDSIILALVRKQYAFDSGVIDTVLKDDADAEFCMFRERIPLHEARESWHKIPYGVPWTKRLFTRAGTANPINADPVEEVMSRIAFVWKNSALLRNMGMEHTSEKDISECVVVWCKTGNFHSYHGLAKVGHHGADMGSNATMAGSIVSQIVASAVVPIAAPVFVVYDLANTVKSMRASQQCQKEWRRITWEWNDRYSVTKTLKAESHDDPTQREEDQSTTEHSVAN
ncbi:unnamed protein product [Cylindrotheca closterium]|uniref:Uncharacterized protein n=1 Tax=Cylindrotheca closterium TaxID=2856 RepID=A0AAD2JHH8_9STRA|nr:unnamed protein product [Cylindrotheca closterium]